MVKVLTFSPRGAPNLSPFEVINIPLVELVPTINEEEVLEALEWAEVAVFTSPTGVQFLFKEIPGLKEKLKGKVVFAIGPRTKEELEKRGVNAFLPKEYHSTSLASELSKYSRIVAFRSDKASRTLKEALGSKLREVIIYKTVRKCKPEIVKVINEVDAVVVSSAEIGRALIESLKMANEDPKILEGKLIVIGPEAAKALRGIRYEIAPEASFEGVRKKLLELFKSYNG